MAERWRFFLQEPTDRIHNPISAEFFSTEAVGDVTEALIREGIQNTLDARRKRPDPSREQANVRIFLSETAGARPGARVRQWFTGLWRHVLAPGNGLRDQPGPDEPCPFLVFEDFGTIGLTGDPEEYRIVDNVQNHFLNFFRAEGHSDKGETDRGSWGVGKTVFPRASRISSFFGLTVRSDDGRRLLLGQSVLKYHRVNGDSFKADGYFGLGRDDGLVLPCDDVETLNEFCSDFSIKRRDEPGLSLVVPWYYMEGDDGVTREKVVVAVLRGFFYPILMGDLSVTVATAAGEIILDQNSIMTQVRRIGGTLADDLLPRLELAEWAQTRTPDEFQTLTEPASDRRQKWSADLVPVSVVEHIRQSLGARQRVALRVPMSVQPKSGEPQATFFKVYLEHSERDTEKPLFIRDELIIPDVKSRRVNEIRALVIVEDKPLGNLLRDAETPAHTQWNQETSHFKHNYKFGPGAISFVSQSVSELMHIVNQADRNPDPTLTIDFFSLPAPPEDDEAVPARRRRTRSRPGDEPNEPPVPPLPPARPRRFRIDKLRGGFAIRPGDPGVEQPEMLQIRVAYDVRRGNPLHRFHPADVDLRTLEVESSSAKVDSIEPIAQKGLTVLVRLLQPDFHFQLTGFDSDRDLYVRAEAKEIADAD
jgi:hypothetical protein